MFFTCMPDRQTEVPDISLCRAIILAAGKSQRMGVPKSEVLLPGGRSFLQSVYDVYTSLGCRHITVVTHAEGEAYVKAILPDVSTAVNTNPSQSRFSSLQTGIHALLADADCQHGSLAVFVHPVDTPLITARVPQALWTAACGKAREKALIIPEYQKKGGHPVLLSAGLCLDIARFGETDIHMRRFLHSYPWFRLSLDAPEILANINNPEDYYRYTGAKAISRASWAHQNQAPSPD